MKIGGARTPFPLTSSPSFSLSCPSSSLPLQVGPQASGPSERWKRAQCIWPTRVLGTAIGLAIWRTKKMKKCSKDTSYSRSENVQRNINHTSYSMTSLLLRANWGMTEPACLSRKVLNAFRKQLIVCVVNDLAVLAVISFTRYSTETDSLIGWLIDWSSLEIKTSRSQPRSQDHREHFVVRYQLHQLYISTDINNTV